MKWNPAESVLSREWVFFYVTISVRLRIWLLSSSKLWYDMIYDMILYYIIWYDVTWRDVTWNEMIIWCDMIRYMIWYDVTWRDMKWNDYMMWYDKIYDMILYYMIWYDVTWRDVTWNEMIIWCDMIRYMIRDICYDMIYLLTAIVLTPGGSSTVHIYRQTIYRTQLIWKECRPCPIFANYTLSFAVQLREKHGKTSVRVAEDCQLVWWKENIQYRTYITITIHKHNNKNT